MKRSAEYRAWRHAKERCLNPRNKDFASYGGRGITMSPEWLRDFSTFLRDMGLRPSGCTLDRKDVNGDYERRNCRWATEEEQYNNRRDNRHVTIAGTTMTIAQWCRRLHLKEGTVRMRLYQGDTPERALRPTG